MSFPGRATPGIEGYALRQARAVQSNVAGTVIGQLVLCPVMAMAVIRGYKPHGQRGLGCLGKRVIRG
jgi:hypothetical protein